MAQGSYVQTKAHYEEACKKCREQLNPIGESGGLCGLSRIHMLLGETKLALEQAEEALKIRESLGDRKATAECLCLLAEVYIKMGDLRQAQHVCQQARQLSVENSGVLPRALHPARAQFIPHAAPKVFSGCVGIPTDLARLIVVHVYGVHAGTCGLGFCIASAGPTISH